MLGKLESVLLPLIRQPEQTDTHQYIRQHERDSKKRKSGHGSKEALGDDRDDQATMSIEATILFLENMLKSETVSPDTAGVTVSQTMVPTENSPRIRPSLYAANAYAHAAKTSPVHNSEPTETIATPPKQTVNNSVVGEIYLALIDLKKRGVEELKIERSDTFLNSLLNAIDNARAGL